MDARALLRRLVSIKSVFPGENEISEYLGGVLRDEGFSVRKVSTQGRMNIVATHGRQRKYLCLYGHMDTVPPNEGMRSPYRLIERNGIGRGLGAGDMKGGVAAIVTAAKSAAEQGLPLKVALGVGEENISEGAHSMIDSGALDDAAFIISGESGESGGSAAPGRPFNVRYGRKGRLVFDARIHGKRAHAANKREGINAIERASRFVRMAETMRFPLHRQLGSTDVVVQGIRSDADSFSVPDACDVQFSLLTTPNVKSRQVIERMEGWCMRNGVVADIRPHLRATPYGESYEVDRSHPFIVRLERELFEPLDVRPAYAASVADENVFANRLGIPVISMGPVSGGLHSANEWIRLDSLDNTVRAYEKAIELYHS
jgi:acetylornithine deacetylase